MTDSERKTRYDALTDQERTDFHARLDEYADTLLNPNQGPYDNGHWHKVPPSPIVITTADPKPGDQVSIAEATAPVVRNPTPPAAPPAARKPFWGWMH